MEIVTKDDLRNFRLELLRDIRVIVNECLKSPADVAGGYKTSHVRKMLGCSVNKLVSLRTTRKLRTKKIGGTLYYNKDDIKRLLDEGY